LETALDGKQPEHSCLQWVGCTRLVVSLFFCVKRKNKCSIRWCWLSLLWTYMWSFSVYNTTNTKCWPHECRYKPTTSL